MSAEPLLELADRRGSGGDVGAQCFAFAKAHGRHLREGVADETQQCVALPFLDLSLDGFYVE